MLSAMYLTAVLHFPLSLVSEVKACVQKKEEIVRNGEC